MQYLEKLASVFNSSFSFKYQKPATCPYCNMGTDATYEQKYIASFNGNTLLIATCKCTACGKMFLFVCEKDDKQIAKNVCIYPEVSVKPFVNKHLAAISERFIDIYNQALEAEFAGHFDLAAIGFRTALEILIKDYAINILKEPEASVTSKKLCPAIGEYLHQEEMVKTADVVRILGNDYTHYKRKYPEHDFALLKKYMEIFLSQIEIQYMIKHPPVSRD